MPKKAPKDDDELEVTDRDFVMARIAAGRTAAHDAITMLDEALSLFISPTEDRKGKKRTEQISSALEALGVACRAIETAEANMGEYDPEEEEPWDIDEDEEDLDDDEDEEDDEDDEEEDED